jgi:hypothetical protein
MGIAEFSIGRAFALPGGSNYPTEPSNINLSNTP